jgi:hypothetical protein
MTGAQYLCLLLVGVFFWIWFRVRKLLVADAAAGMVPGIEAPATA